MPEGVRCTQISSKNVTSLIYRLVLFVTGFPGTKPVANVHKNEVSYPVAVRKPLMEKMTTLNK